MFTKEKLIKELKGRNINAILIVNNLTLIFFVENEETRESVNDLMLGSYANTFFHHIVISNIYCEGLAILPVYNLNSSFFNNADGAVLNEISFKEREKTNWLYFLAMVSLAITGIVIILLLI